MLKFFRMYNKYILAVGASLLMIAFLIQPVMSMFMPSPMDQPIGKAHGRELTRADQLRAGEDLQILEALNLPDPLLGDDPLAWLLALEDARHLGLSASDTAATIVLSNALGVRDDDVAVLARRFGTSDERVRLAIRNWLTVQAYRELMLGQVHMDPIERLQFLLTAIRSHQQGDWLSFRAGESLWYGLPRLSEPMVLNFLSKQRAVVSGRLVFIDSRRYHDDVPDPDEQTLQELFERYRDVPEGGGEPYGFGYRLPDRVKIEYVTIPISDVRNVVEVSEAEALQYYDEHPEEFTRSEDERSQIEGVETVPAPRPYEEVRARVFELLRHEKATALAGRIAGELRSLLLTDPATRRLAEMNGYKVIPGDFEPPPLRVVAERIEEQYGVRPRIERVNERWVPAEELPDLTGIGRAVLAPQPNVSFYQYVMSARELEPPSDNPLLLRRLQVGLPSDVLRGADGSRYVFRLTAAEPSRVPDSLDLVRERVERDARALAAYERLREEKAAWRERALAEGLTAVAEQADASVIEMPPTRRREFILTQSQLQVPYVAGVGVSEAFIDTVFEQAERLHGDGGIAAAPQDERIGVVALDERLGMVVYEITDYQPMTAQEYREAVSDQSRRMLMAYVSQTLWPQTPTEPLSLEALAARVGFELDEEDQPDAAEVTAEPAGASF